MKSLYITFDDEEFAELEKVKEKSKLTWKEFIMHSVGGSSYHKSNTNPPTRS